MDFVLDRLLDGGLQNGAYALHSAGSGSKAVLKWSIRENRAGLVQCADSVILELSLAACVLGILTFLVERKPDDADQLFREAAQLIARH